MDFPLMLSVLLERAAKVLGDVEIVSYRPDETASCSQFRAVATPNGRARPCSSGCTPQGTIGTRIPV
jgi:hypothetical protein